MAMFPVQGSNLEIWRQELILKVRADVQVVILLLPGRQGVGSDLYHDLKKMLTEEIPITSQAILTSTVNYGRNLRLIVSKLVAQICAKIGGIPWAVSELPFFDKRTMVCGLDAYHDGEDGLLSVLGFVASYNRTCTKYWSSSQMTQRPGDEIATGLQGMVVQALNHFREANGSLPDRVIIYRDGVDRGDPQMQAMKEVEVEQLKKACAEFDHPIGCIFVVVTRKTNVELYAQGFYEDSFKNVVPGTVLDNGITSTLPSSSGSPDAEALVHQEFFLVSTSQRLGIAPPTKYSVLCDTINEPPSHIHLLSYKLCHMYFNIANPIQLPSPIMYARKLGKFVAERSREQQLRDFALEANYAHEAQDTQVKLSPIEVHSSFQSTCPNLFFL